ncbi:MAG: branched-chain amino acid ABC transporter ATP-binding protein/permease [Candidatus Eremiobacteraeota bacterium]|nr:branched-chain amino acid ABC transporter ATP-binding protein/permease [Candidatus Eremiobacteraeota bacterium]
MTTPATTTPVAPPRAQRSVLGGDIRFALLTALGLALFPLLLHPIGGYPGLATQIVIVSIATIGFNLLLGYAGMLSYGHAMFFGGGGYIAAILLVHWMPAHPNLWLATLGATIATALLAMAIGALTVRLYGIYFALLTLAFAQMVYFLVEQGKGLTNGDDGIQTIPNALVSLGTWNIDLTASLPALDLGPFGNVGDLKLWYVFAALMLLIVLLFVRSLNRSQFGEVLDAIRENEQRSVFVGFNAAAYRLAAFTISGALTGFSGALRALYDGSIGIDAVGIDRSGSFVIYAVVGGVQTLFGPVAGTAVIMFLENVLSAKTPAWRLIEGLIFVGVIVFLPRGLSTLFKRRQTNPYAVFRRSLALPTEEPDPLLKPADQARPGGPTSIVETLKLGKSFGHFAAVREVDFRVDPGELRAVIGPNGAGKTTFFNLIAGTIAPSSGTIRYRGRDVTRVSGTSRVHMGIAKAFQTANLFADQTVRQNCRLAALASVQGSFAPQVFRRSIRLADVDALAERAMSRLELAGVEDVRAGDLSHGDKKRLDIAIALATQPQILLLDEPVAGMSKDEARKTEALIRNLSLEMTVLVIEHDMEMVMGLSDTITVLHQGTVLATGTPAEIQANPRVQEAYLGGHSEAELAH